MPCVPDRAGRQSGFTLVELMIALVLGMIIIGSSVALFISQRMTTKLASQMSDIQNEGRIALDAVARDLRAAGDFGCALAEPPINALVNTSIFDAADGGVRGFDKGASLNGSSLTGGSTVSGANPASDVLVASGVSRVVTTLTQATTDAADQLLVVDSTPSLASGDVAIVTNCISLSKFQVTGYSVNSDGKGVVTHAIATTPATLGGGNTKADLGSVYPSGATVAKLDTRWWFVGQPTGKPKGLYRVDAGSGALILVSPRVVDMRVRYEVDSDGDGIADQFDRTAAQVSSWTTVTAAAIELLAKSPDNVQNQASPYVFGGQSVTPSDRAAYMPVRVNLGLRNK
ncbi:MAG: PilW family protein [Rhodocyclaceae bacterium]